MGAAAYGNGVYAVTEPDFYSSALFTSTNGTAWTQVSRIPNPAEVNNGVFWSALYGGGKWVGVNAYESFLMHP